MGWRTLSDFPELPLRIGIEYELTRQIEITNAIIDMHLRHIADCSDFTSSHQQAKLEDATGSLGVFLSTLLYSFKHRSFAEEREFRWVYHALDGRIPNGSSRGFREFGRMVKPFIDVDFPRAELVGIVYGPTAHSQLTPKWLRSALDTYGYEATKITASEVPMR